MADVLSPADTTVPSAAFNKRIWLWLPADTVSDGQGGSVRFWTNVLQTWAHIEPWKGAEVWSVQQKYSNMWSKVLIRYRPSMNITPVMRMTYGNRTYDVRSASVPGEALTTIQLLVEELQVYGSLH